MTRTRPIRSIRGEGSAVRPQRAFTLIELLVVVAIIALLISILLPSLSRAREQAKAVQCGSNLSGVGKAVAIYLGENKDGYPLSYFYASDQNGGQDLKNQATNKQWGYYHWSWFLFGKGEVDDKAFQCPTIPEKGGHPRTNPGPDPANWFDDQVGDGGSNPSKPSQFTDSLVEDRQAKFMAYTANAAVMPRNKLGNLAEGGNFKRSNRFVKDSEIKEAGRTILATEFNRNWRVISLGNDDKAISKSHRPTNVFYNEGSGFDELDLDPKLGIYRYWIDTTGNAEQVYGLKPLQEIEEGAGSPDSPTYQEANYIGRHHPGGDKLGGTANFAFVDGHVDRIPVLKTLENRLWGDKVYGVTGNNKLDPKSLDFIPKVSGL